MEHLEGAEQEELLGNDYIPEIRIDAEPPNFNPPPIENIENSSRFCDYLKITLGNIFLFLYSMVKIALCLIIYNKDEPICSEPLDIWLLLVIANESILIIYTIFAFMINYWLYRKKCNDFMTNREFLFGNNLFSLEDLSFLSGNFEGNDLIQFLNNFDNYNFHLRLNHEAEKIMAFLTYIRHMNHFLYLILFLWGCFLMTTKNNNCAMVCPITHYFCMVLLLISFLYIFLPLFLLMSICFCIPCLLISSLFCGPRPTKSIEKDFIKKLERKDYNKKDFVEHEDCVICRSSFTKKDKLIVLPCSRKHYFHEGCVEKWLDISCLCPICRADLNKKMKDNITSQQNNNDINNLNQIILALNDDK